MSNVSDILEAFCWRCKVHEIWKPRSTPAEQPLSRLHSQAAVFNVVYQSKNSAVPSVQKINETIQYLDENEFWRKNPLTLFTNHKDPTVIETIKALQSPEILNLWNKEVPCNRQDDKVSNKPNGGQKEDPSVENFENGKDVFIPDASSVKRVEMNVVKEKGDNSSVPQNMELLRKRQNNTAAKENAPKSQNLKMGK